MARCQAWTGLNILLAAISASSALVLESETGQQSVHALHPRQSHSRPWKGNGTCFDPVYNEQAGTTTVTCLGPKQMLSPGQTEDVMITLASPYPEGKMSVVLSQTSQLVDEDLKPVPLSDVYVHHYSGSYNFLLGSGAELRGSLSRKPLPEPYHLIVNGTEVASEAARLTNIQLINTVGLPLEQAKPCLECWCDHDSLASPTSSNLTVGQQHAQADRGDPTFANARPASLKGSLLCCHQCPTTSDAGPRGYHLQYNVTFRPLQGEKDTANATSYTLLDVMDGHFEYQITKSLGPNSTHTLVHDTVYDQLCPQRHNLDILRCTGHQHFGGQCIELINLDKNEPICKSCPDFGIKWGVPGDEAGYVVKIEDDTLPAPYTIAPGTHVRMVSTYSSEVPRFGVMGLMFVWQAGQYEPCHIAPNVSSTTYTATTSGSDTDILVPLYGHGMFGVGADLPAGTNVHVS